MSLVNTLAKVAIGVAVAKGVSTLARGSATRPSGSANRTGGGSGSITDILGDMMGSAAGGRSTGGMGTSGTGGLGDLLGGMMGGTTGRAATPGGTGSLGDLLGGMMGTPAGRSGSTGGGNMLDQLGQMMGGGAGGIQGGLGGLLDALGGGAAAGGLGGLLNESLTQGAPKTTPSAAQEQQAALLLRAMIQAAKSDGRIDQAEKEALTKHLGDVSREEARIIEQTFAEPVDIDRLANDTPKGMEGQVYMMSLLGLDLDSQAEAQYLHGLAQKLGIDPKSVNAIHQKMGEPALYS